MSRFLAGLDWKLQKLTTKPKPHPHPNQHPPNRSQPSSRLQHRRMATTKQRLAVGLNPVLLQLIGLLNKWLEGKPELKLIFAIWIRAVLLRQSKHTLVLPKVNDLKELKMSLAERFNEWTKEYERKGIEKGIETGEALLLQRQLVKRFGALSSDNHKSNCNR